MSKAVAPNPKLGHCLWMLLEIEAHVQDLVRHFAKKAPSLPAQTKRK